MIHLKALLNDVSVPLLTQARPYGHISVAMIIITIILTQITITIIIIQK